MPPAQRLALALEPRDRPRVVLELRTERLERLGVVVVEPCQLARRQQRGVDEARLNRCLRCQPDELQRDGPK